MWGYISLGVGKLLTNPEHVWHYYTIKGDSRAACEFFWPTGRTLGGSSSVNGMLFVCGIGKAWDEWRKLGNGGWRYDDVLPW
jgi:choline dehydrogenase